MGIVPDAIVSDFTYGRSAELQYLENWFAGRGSANRSCMLIEGAYGAGKSHLLRYAYLRAIELGYAAAVVSVDPTEVPFHRPHRVYRKLIANFAHSRDGKPRRVQFREFLQDAFKKGMYGDHPILRLAKTRLLGDLVWEWIEASDGIGRAPDPSNPSSTPLVPLYDYGTAGNIYCNLLSAISWGLAHATGLHGLVLLFDEAEAADTGFLTALQKQRGWSFVKALVQASLNDPRLLQLPSETGLDYCKINYARRLPFVYRSPSELRLIFAVTPNSAIASWDVLHLGDRVELQPLDESAFRQIANTVSELHATAYQWTVPEPQYEVILQRIAALRSNPRQFIKGLIELLDVLRFNGDREPPHAGV